MHQDDIRDRTVELPRKFGDAAHLYASTKADAAFPDGAADQHSVWTRIAALIADIEEVGPKVAVQ